MWLALMSSPRVCVPGVTKLLQLATNENPFGTSPKAAEAICQQAPLANRYPDVRAQDLRKKLAVKHGLTPEQIMVTEGATAGLGFIAEVFIRQGDEIILTPPTYPSYYNYVKRCCGKLVEVPLERTSCCPTLIRSWPLSPIRQGHLPLQPKQPHRHPHRRRGAARFPKEAARACAAGGGRGLHRLRGGP